MASDSTIQHPADRADSRITLFQPESPGVFYHLKAQARLHPLARLAAAERTGTRDRWNPGLSSRFPHRFSG
jgi:hypothetical protein